MARITVEDCLEKVETRFELVMLAARRAKMLIRGAKPVVGSTNRAIVTALREVAARKAYLVEPPSEDQEEGDVEGVPFTGGSFFTHEIVVHPDPTECNYSFI
jgi:DNA-directed RNA polymerase subunit omega